ncbi:type IX secretion system protein PorG [Bacteroides heparinolyticus]|uniref:type IX secretion system protein PorG n=1 Tax=Prevotella heparinolytica TaxID=28113 RepID=UPI003F9F12CC
MRKATLLLLMLAAMLNINAQTDDEYLMEIGGGVGFLGYLGDYNNVLTRDLQPMATLLVRRNLNPYMGLRLAASFGKLKGDERDVKTVYPSTGVTPYSFSRTLTDVSLTYEYNFWPYGTGHDYYGAKRLTPFVFLGLGGTYAGGDGSSVFTANVPIGLGLKYKVGQRMNVGVEWAMHFSMSDKLDGRKDPYGITSSGMFKNTDCYSVLQLTLSYSFMPKCTTCNKD